MATKAAQRQANYREFFQKGSDQVREGLAGQPQEKVDEFVADYQQRLDMMFSSVPQIADSWQQFVVASNEITYRMTMDNPDIPKEAKDAFAQEHRSYLRQSKKNWPRVVLVLVIVVALVAIALMLALGVR